MMKCPPYGPPSGSVCTISTLYTSPISGGVQPGSLWPKVAAMSTRYYKSDKKIRNTITEVIRSFARAGDVIIVGRGGVAFGKDNTNSLHIKLTAPIEWRVDRIRRNYNKTESDALLYVLEVDQKRKFLIDSFMGFDTDLSIFDLVFNRKTMSEDEIVSTILHLIDQKKMISSS